MRKSIKWLNEFTTEALGMAPLLLGIGGIVYLLVAGATSSLPTNHEADRYCQKIERWCHDRIIHSGLDLTADGEAELTRRCMLAKESSCAGVLE